MICSTSKEEVMGHGEMDGRILVLYMRTIEYSVARFHVREQE
jgi:hypothetical protein